MHARSSHEAITSHACVDNAVELCYCPVYSEYGNTQFTCVCVLALRSMPVLKMLESNVGASQANFHLDLTFCHARTKSNNDRFRLVLLWG